MNNREFETAPIGSLVRRFSVPCVISMVVAALYNIVDQIYIGWSPAGADGNAATNIVYPFTVLALGLALLIGDGVAANFSIACGGEDRKRAGKYVGNGIVLLILFSCIVCAAGFLFMPGILRIFGADPAEAKCYRYARDYYSVICAGVPLYMLGQGLNGTIRANGSPKFAMACTLAGAVTNIILDPVFIFTLGMEVRGAAIATVIGQAVTFVMSLLYMLRIRTLGLSREAFRPGRQYIGQIVSVGMASLIVQLSIVVIIAVNNNLLNRFGNVTYASTGVPYGVVTPLAVIGIVMKVFGIVVSIVIGISLGGQPIIGYNMGAGNTDRVKQTVTYLTKIVLLVGVIAFLIFELAPDAVISLFGSHNTPEYMEYARLCIRIFLGGIILTCYVKSSSVILQSMGDSVKSTVLALLRDVIAFVPASLILAYASRSIVVMLWAAVIADVIAAVTAFILVSHALKKLPENA